MQVGFAAVTVDHVDSSIAMRNAECVQQGAIAGYDLYFRACVVLQRDDGKAVLFFMRDTECHASVLP